MWPLQETQNSTFDIRLLFLPLKAQVTEKKSKICLLCSEVLPVCPMQFQCVFAGTLYLSTVVSWEDSTNQGTLHPSPPRSKGLPAGEWQ